MGNLPVTFLNPKNLDLEEAVLHKPVARAVYVVFNTQMAWGKRAILLADGRYEFGFRVE